MLSPMSLGDWSSIDIWWGSFNRDDSSILAPASIREMPDVTTARHWSSLESLRNAFESDYKLLFVEKHVRELSDSSEADGWEQIDNLWNRYVECQQDDLLELREVLADLREAWTDGASQFGEDPLSTNSRSKPQYEGPLRTTIKEEDWSHWLAYLLRISSGPFAHELLGTCKSPPTNVWREVRVSDENSRRRADILVEYENLGVSIEIKQGDENYRKIPETAGLIEQKDHREWSHALLLQKDKVPRLQQKSDIDLDRSGEGSATIESNQSADIDVRYWRDVSRVLRQILLEGREPDSHWKASAYLFISLIEQRVLGLRTLTDTSQTIDTDSETAPITDVQRLVAMEQSTRMDYLRAVVPEDSNHE